MRTQTRECGICGESMRGTVEDDVWMPDEQVAEVYDPEDDRESVTCHVSCIPDGWETA